MSWGLRNVTLIRMVGIEVKEIAANDCLDSDKQSRQLVSEVIDLPDLSPHEVLIQDCKRRIFNRYLFRIPFPPKVVQSSFFKLPPKKSPRHVEDIVLLLNLLVCLLSDTFSIDTNYNRIANRASKIYSKE